MEEAQLYKEMNNVDQLLAEQKPHEALELIARVRSQILPSQQQVLARSYAWEITCYKHLLDVDNAIASGEKGLEIYERLNDKLGVSRVNRDMGLTYEYDKQYEKALQYMDLALEAAQADTSDPDLAMQYQGITLAKKGQIYYEMGKVEEGLPYAQKGYDILKGATHLGFKLTSCIIAARVHIALNHFDVGAVYIVEAKDYLDQIKEKEGYLNEKRYCEIEGLIATLEMKRDDVKLCLEHFSNILKYMLKPVKEQRKRMWDDIQIEKLYDFLKEKGYEEDIKQAIAAYYKEHKNEVDWNPHDVKEEMRDNRSTR